MIRRFGLDTFAPCYLKFEKEYLYKAIDSNTHTAAAIKLMPIN